MFYEYGITVRDWMVPWTVDRLMGSYLAFSGPGALALSGVSVHYARDTKRTTGIHRRQRNTGGGGGVSIASQVWDNVWLASWQRPIQRAIWGLRAERHNIVLNIYVLRRPSFFVPSTKSFVKYRYRLQTFPPWRDIQYLPVPDLPTPT